MRKLLLFIFLSALNFSIAQTEDSVDMNGGYAMDVFYSFENGTVQTVANAEWTVAMSTGAQTASIYINDGNGVELYETTEPISNFASFDTTGLSSWPESYNSYNDWEHSAFEKSATGHPNYGWGSYSSISHIVVGDKIFILKTLADEYYKAIVVKKESGAWHYRYASLDNSFDTTIVYQATDLFDRNFAYLNMDNHLVSNREPANTDWDMLFTRYYDEDESHIVTGLLVNKGVQIVQIDGVSHTAADYTGETFSDITKEIGSDWKLLDMGSNSYSIATDRTYFVKQVNGAIYKIFFTRFDGSTTGKIVFNKEKLTASSLNKLDNLDNLESATIYPNPTKNSTQLILDINKSTSISYSIYNMLGKLMVKDIANFNAGLNTIKINTTSYTAGVYLVQIKNGEQVETLKLNVTK